MAQHRHIAAVGSGHWTTHGKSLVAQSMYEKGKAFVAASMLLRQRGAYEYAVLHLLCQGIEVMAKGYLLSVNYDHYKPKLRDIGHDLLRALLAVEHQSQLPLLTPRVRVELDSLNPLYKQHLLRYGSGYDLLVNPKTIPTSRVLSRTAAVLRIAQRSKLPAGESHLTLR